MIKADKIKIIQDLQCKHANWLFNYNKALSLSTCVETWIENNISISNFIETVYRYKPFELEVTNADKVIIQILTSNPNEVYEITISYGGTVLVNFNGTGSQESIAQELCELINLNSSTHEYYCVVEDNCLYLYTFSLSATYSDTPLLTFSELDTSEMELTMSTTPLSNSELGVILNLQNCLTLTELCNIITKTRALLKNCNCK